MAETRKVRLKSYRRDTIRPLVVHKRRRATTSVPTEELAKELDLRDTLRALYQEIQSLSDPLLKEQYEHAIHDVAKDGDLSRIIELTRYRRAVVPLDEFLCSRTYLGMDQSELFPCVNDTLEALENEQYVEAVLKGAIGRGKTTAANLSIARQVYKISCMRHPQKTFGLQSHSAIVFTIQSVRLSTAKRAVFEEFGKYIHASPYFNQIFKYDKRINSSMYFPEHHIQIMPVSSSDTGAISMNVIGGLLDEVNFMERVKNSKQANADEHGDYDQARTLYLTLAKRRRSRFLKAGKLPGTLFLVSSTRYPDDFTETKAAEAAMCGGRDAEIYVNTGTLWDGKGREKYAAEEFRVLLGNERVRPRIVEDNEVINPEDGLEVIRVPVDLKTEFEKDVAGSIRDLAGRTTLASSPFIYNREALQECMALADQYDYQSVVAVQEIDLETQTPIIIPEYVRTDVSTMRVCHVDLALTRDAAGIAIGHVAGTRTINRTKPGEEGSTIEVLPVIAYDLILRVVPPANGEIDFSKIRGLILKLRDDYHLPIKVVTTDGFQSTDFRQILAKRGFVTDYLSLDRNTQPYRTLRDALYDKRILLPRHQHLISELTELEYIAHGSKEKVDHKPRGSKDIADAVAGVAAYLLTRRSAWTSQPTFQGANGLLLHGHRTSLGAVELEEADYDTLPSTGGRATITRRSVSRMATRKRKKAD